MCGIGSTSFGQPCSAASIEAVELLWIRLEDFADHPRCNTFIIAQQMNGVELGRGIMVTVVGADHQTILARMAQDVRQIISVFARHPQVVCRERVGWKRPPLTPEAIG